MDTANLKADIKVYFIHISTDFNDFECKNNFCLENQGIFHIMDSAFLWSTCFANLSMKSAFPLN